MPDTRKLSQLMGAPVCPRRFRLVQARKAEAALARDRVRKVGRGFWRAHATAVLADIDLHENVERGSRADGRLGEAREGFDVVHDRSHMNARGEGCDTAALMK